MAKNQIKKNKRDDLKPIIITKRDKIVMAKIAEYRIMSTEQLYRLCFPSIGRARKRLLQLQRHGYLKRIIRPIRMGEGTSMYLHLLTRKAKSILPTDIKIIEKRPSSIIPEHAIGINDFRAALELSTRELETISLNSWNQGKELLMRSNTKDKGIIKQVPILPDAYFSVKRDERLFHYFLEIDRGMSDLKRITLKCRAYLNLWRDKTIHDKLELRSFRLLYVTVSEKRLANMLGQLQKLKSHHPRLDLIMLTTAERFCMAKPCQLFEPIWNILDTEGNIRKIGLLPITSLQSSRQREENHHCAVQNPIPVNGIPGPGG